MRADAELRLGVAEFIGITTLSERSKNNKITAKAERGINPHQDFVRKKF